MREPKNGFSLLYFSHRLSMLPDPDALTEAVRTQYILFSEGNGKDGVSFARIQSPCEIVFRHSKNAGIVLYVLPTD